MTTPRRRIAVLPGRTALSAVAALAAGALVALLLGMPAGATMRAALLTLAAVVIVSAADFVLSRRAWRRTSPSMTRVLPPAFAIAVRQQVHLRIELPTGGGRSPWRLRLHDHADPGLAAEGLPATLVATPGTALDVTYLVTPTVRGDVVFAPADVRVRSRWGLCELLESLGDRDARRVYPDFAQISRYAWLAGDRRLQEIGIKTYQQRGEGTDFKQLAEYRVGDALRHIDWRATQRMGKPIVRQFQDERDQCVMLLVDCGRRMRAEDRASAAGGTHFDHVLTAVMLLSYVALRQGDAVGAMTFGTPSGEDRSFAPAKGTRALNALMGQLYDVQPSPTHADYVAAAQALLRHQRKRALVVVITNFRDEASVELGHALRLLRSRHLVLVASLRERIVRELAAQPLSSGDAAIDVASAHLYEQASRDAFRRLAARDALIVSAEPEHLGVELVNRYHAVKRAGMM
jgi:uncharacterized protein (DUF58 family)